MGLVLIILYNTHTTVWSSLSLRQFSEVTILPDTPQHWNCEFSLETLTFLWEPEASSLWNILVHAKKKKKRKLCNTRARNCCPWLNRKGWATYCLPLHRTCFPWPSYLSPVHQLFPSTGNLQLCRNLFPYLPIHICNMPRYLNVSSASWISFLLQLVYKSFWPCQCFLNSQDLPP